MLGTARSAEMHRATVCGLFVWAGVWCGQTFGVASEEGEVWGVWR